ncbi:DNA polymerase delta subunit 4 [Lepisosteus oculatus]|uniref:DNA polymerase delta subunit 4 n=1 Tax=Lepisosteus oculatus TaxID=7918 RepID=UPI0037121600
MAPKRRLITDSFKVVKRVRIEEKKESPVVEEKEPETDSPPLSEREQDLEELKKFDLDWHYGPCTGITRLQRWQRAERWGLSPPRRVREILRRHAAEEDYTHCLWHEYPL